MEGRSIRKLVQIPNSAIAIVLAFAVFSVNSARADDVRVINLEGIISVANADFFLRALNEAQEDGGQLVVLRLDTPGGLDQPMRNMIKAILASRIPVAVYVAPSGARAASAGTFLMYASHIGAMAPATNIGSSTPVPLTGSDQEGSSDPKWNPFDSKAPEEKTDNKAEGGEKGDGNGNGESDSRKGEQEPPTRAKGSSMNQKIMNDAVAYIKGLAELRGRNKEWAEKTVTEAANLTASEALEQNVVEFIASDLSDLLAQIDGMTLTFNGITVTLDTKDALITQIKPDWRNKLLAILTNPTVALGLISLGVWGLIYEFMNPGSWVGGVAGVIFILLGAYGLNMLPINYAGVLLVLLGIALMIFEAITPTFGVLLVGGLASFIIGAIILFDSDMPGLGIHVGVTSGFAIATALLSVFVVGSAIRARNAPVATGAEALVGTDAVVLTGFTGAGRVRAAGEIWQAVSDESLKDAQQVKITELDGLTLKVAPKEQGKA